MTCGIYMIQNKVNGKIYIGQAVDIEYRWRHHKAELRGNYHINKHLLYSWNKYGESNFKFTIICECDESQLNTMEEYYIFELMSYDVRVGYNKNYGGGSGRPTEETKKKVSESLKGKYVGENSPNYGRHPSEETRKKISENTGSRRPEVRRKNSEAHKGEKHPNYGKHLSEETRRKISEAGKGRIVSEETRKKLCESSYWHGRHGSENSHSIPIVQLTKDGKLIEVHESQHEAKKKGFSQGNIGACCRGERSTHRGYIWMYLHEYKTLSEESIKKICETKSADSKGKNSTRPIPIVQLTLDGQLVNVYGSAGEAEREGFGHQTIGCCCKGKLKKHKGYKWMYLSEYIAKMHPNIKKINLMGKTYEVNQEEVKIE